MSLYEFHSYDDNKFALLHVDVIDKRIETHGIANWHDDIELIYCTEGTGEAIINSEHVPMEKGTITIINPNKIHYIAPISETLRYYVLIIDSKALKASGIDVKKLVFETSVSDDKATSFFEKIINEDLNRHAFSTPVINGLVLSLMAHICIFYSREKTESSDEDGMIKIIDYIRENFKNDITLDDIANHAGFSRYYISRKFKKQTGFAVKEYIQMIRCYEAHAMLRTHKYTVTEVAAECGFSNSSYFTKTYKKYFSSLPSQSK